MSTLKVGQQVDVKAVVGLGQLKHSDVKVQLYFGPLNTQGDIEHGTAVDMTHVSSNGGEDTYTATATMTLKGKETSVPLDFQLTINGDQATLDGKAVFSRKALDLGQVSDASGSWVSDEITVTVSGTATRTG